MTNENLEHGRPEAQEEIPSDRVYLCRLVRRDHTVFFADHMLRISSHFVKRISFIYIT